MLGKGLSWVAVLALAAVLFFAAGCALKGNPQDTNTGAQPGDQNQPILEPPVAPPPDGPGNTPAGNNDVNAASEAALKAELDRLINGCMEQDTKLKVDTCIAELAKDRKNDYPCSRLAYLPVDRCLYEVSGITHSEATCMKISNLYLREECLVNSANALKDIKICGGLTDIVKMDICIAGIAEANKSAEECNEIYDSTKRDACYMAVAGSTKDNSFCEKVTSRHDSGGYNRDKCYYAAEPKLEGELCFKIIDAELKRECFLNAENAPEKETSCAELTDSEAKQNCMYWHATKSGSVQECDSLPYAMAQACINDIITGTPEAEQCIYATDYSAVNLCYYNAALEGNSDAPCAAISGDPDFKDQCFGAMAAKLENSEICRSIRVNNFTGRDECFTETALATQDFTICEYVKTDKLYYKCFAQVAADVGVPDVCSKTRKQRLIILPYPPSQYCYKEYAVKASDRTVCHVISVPALKNNCYTEIGIKDGDNSICSFIEKTERRADCREAIEQAGDGKSSYECILQYLPGNDRDECYLNYAQENGDEGVCDYIEEDLEKSQCLRLFE